jgi:Preprotein translocase subunit SecA (ATPase, RNA helicase)
LIGYLVKKIFGTKNEREIKRLREIVNKINKLEPELDALSNKELIEESNKLKEKLEVTRTFLRQLHKEKSLKSFL